MAKFRLLPCFAAFLLSLPLVSCTQHRQIRTNITPVEIDWNKAKTYPKYKEEVGTHSIETSDEYLLGYVEYDDQGEPWSQGMDQLKAFEKAVEEDPLTKTNGAIIIVFVHGWKHNAEICDQNVTCFRQVLQTLHQDEETLKEWTEAWPEPHRERRIIGLYVGWRGLSITPWALRELSFYGRKEVAHRIGSSAVPLLERLDALTARVNAKTGEDETGSARLIVIGHSFGGTLLFSGVSNHLEKIAQAHVARYGESPEVCAPEVERLFAGEATYILVNPAFEASLYTNLDGLMHQFNCAANDQSPLLVLAGSENDKATKGWFPLGRRLGTLFEKTRDARQRRRIIQAVGHYSDYATHKLLLSPQEETTDPQGFAADLRAEETCACNYKIDPLDPSLLTNMTREGQTWRELLPSEADWTLSEPINGFRDNSPFMVLNVSRDVIPGHNEIYSSTFIEFLRDLIVAIDISAKGDDEESSAPAGK